MSGQFFLPRLFFIGGGLMAVMGLILWCAMGIAVFFPPYLATAMLSIVYGLACPWLEQKTGAEKQTGAEKK